MPCGIYESNDWGLRYNSFLEHQSFRIEFGAECGNFRSDGLEVSDLPSFKILQNAPQTSDKGVLDLGLAAEGLGIAKLKEYHIICG